MEIVEPSLLFYPQSYRHGFVVKNPVGAELVCAAIDLGAGLGNPLLRGLPPWMVVTLSSIPGVDATVALLFDEAFASRPGRTPAVDRLAEYFVVLLLRHALDARLIAGDVVPNRLGVVQAAALLIEVRHLGVLANVDGA